MTHKKTQGKSFSDAGNSTGRAPEAGIILFIACMGVKSPIRVCSPPGSFLCPWYSPGENTGVGCHALFQEILTTQGLNLHLLHFLHWQVDS